MSNTGSDKPIAYTSLSETSSLMKTAYPPSPTQVDEKMLPELPDDWKPPSSPHSRMLFVVACILTVRDIDLKKFWHHVQEENGWKSYLAHTHKAVAQITVAQGLVLTASAAFMTSPGPPIQSISYTSPFCYGLFFASFMTSISGMVFQVLFFSIGDLLPQHNGSIVQRPLRNAALCYAGVYSMTICSFIFSLLWLASALVFAFLGKWFFIAMAVPVLVSISAFLMMTRSSLHRSSLRVGQMALTQLIVMLAIYVAVVYKVPHMEN